MALLLDLLVSGQTRLNDDTYAKNIYADKFIRTGSSDLYVLLGGGGHKLLSDFSMAHSHPYLPLSGGTMTGALTVKQYIFGYNYNHAGGNAPAFLFDKPGSYYTGIGANGETDTIYFSAATISNGEASWVTSYKQKWKFNGTIYQENNAVIHAGNIGSQSVSYATSAGNADTVDSQHFSYSNDSNSPTYLWATNSNGSSFLAARGSISVNYANSAGTTTTLYTNNTAQDASLCYNESPGLHFYRFNGTGNDIGGGDGFILQWSWNPGSVGGQIYLDDNPSKIAAIRGYDSNSKTFTSWSKFIHSTNYTDYVNTTNFPGLNKVGTVTSVTVTGANGLSGTGTITSSGTITLSNAGVRSTTINGNYLRVNTNGTNTDLTIPYASSATNSSYYTLGPSATFTNVWDCNSPDRIVYSDYGSSGRNVANSPAGWTYGTLLELGHMNYRGQNSSLNLQLMWDVAHNTTNGGTLWFRCNCSTYKWAKNWCKVITDQNYSSYALPLSGGWMDYAGQIYFKGLGQSTTVYSTIGYRASLGGSIMHHESKPHQNSGAFYIATNGCDSANDWGGLAIDNEGVTVFGAGDTGSVFRVLNEDKVSDGAQFYVTKASGTVSKYTHSISNGLLKVTNNSNTMTIGSQNSSYGHIENSANIPFYFNRGVQIDGAIWRYNTNYGITSDGYFHAKAVYANRDGSTTGGGVSLYSNSDPMTYGIAFRGTGTYGIHGYVTSANDWATYLTMSDDLTRGWIFRRGSTNVASIAGNGNMAIGQHLKFSNEAHISTNRSNDYHYGYTFNLGDNTRSIGMYSGPAGEAGGVVISPDGCLIYNSSDCGYNLQVRDKDLGGDLTNIDTLTFGIEQSGYYAWSRGGFKKNGSSDSYFLLGGGGHTATSNYSLSTHTHTFNLGSTTITTNGGSYSGITGPFAVATSASAAKAFSILRDSASEGVQHWVDDGQYHIDYTNDETSSSIHIRIINTDTESGNKTNTTDYHYYLDCYGNFYPGSNNTGGIGTAGYKWANMYATTFHGSLDGNASTATSATSATQATNLTPENTAHYFRDPNSSAWRGGMIWGSAGSESMSFVVANSGTRFQFVGGSDIATWGSSTWQSVNPYLTIYSSGIVTPGSATASGGFIKSGYDNNYVLLAGGGHKSLSDFSMSHSHSYLLLSGGWMDTDAQIYFKGAGSSTSVYGTLGFRSTSPNGFTMHYTNAQSKALFLCVNGYDSATDNGGLAIDNDGVTVFGAGDAGSVFRVINEDNVSDGAQFYVTKASGVFAKYSITASAFYESSDELLKDFYNSIDVDLDKLSSLPKKFFKWKSNPNGEFEIGTSAQELQKIYPQLVNTDDKGYLTVAYDKLSIIALRAIDKLYEMNKNLERRIQILESKL